MPKHKRVSPKKGLHSVLHTVESEVESFHGFVEDQLHGLSDTLGLEDDSSFSGLVHQAEGLFTRARRGLGDAMRGAEAGPAEQVLRKLQDCTREIQHTCVGIARKVDHEFGHLGSEAQHKIHKFVNTIQTFFSKLVEKIGHALKEIRQGLSSMFDGHGHASHHGKAHHNTPHHPEPSSHGSHKKPKPHRGGDY